MSKKEREKERENSGRKTDYSTAFDGMSLVRKCLPVVYYFIISPLMSREGHQNLKRDQNVVHPRSGSAKEIEFL